MKTWWENVLMVVVLAVIAALFGAVMSEGGHIDNGATRGYADASVAAETAARIAADLAGSNGVPLTATHAAAAVMATGTVYNASNLDGVAANRYPTNLAAGVLDPWNTTSNIVSYTDSTVTVTRAMGLYIAWSLTNNATLTFDLSTYPTNGTPDISVSINKGTNSITFNTSTISTNAASATPPGSGGFALTNSVWHRFIFGRAYGTNSVMAGVQIQ
jgi:hypothetical protein